MHGGPRMAMQYRIEEYDEWEVEMKADIQKMAEMYPNNDDRPEEYRTETPLGLQQNGKPWSLRRFAKAFASICFLYFILAVPFYIISCVVEYLAPGVQARMAAQIMEYGRGAVSGVRTTCEAASGKLLSSLPGMLPLGTAMGTEASKDVESKDVDPKTT